MWLFCSHVCGPRICTAEIAFPGVVVRVTRPTSVLTEQRATFSRLIITVPPLDIIESRPGHDAHVFAKRRDDKDIEKFFYALRLFGIN